MGFEYESISESTRKCLIRGEGFECESVIKFQVSIRYGKSLLMLSIKSLTTGGLSVI